MVRISIPDIHTLVLRISIPSYHGYPYPRTLDIHTIVPRIYIPSYLKHLVLSYQFIPAIVNLGYCRAVGNGHAGNGDEHLIEVGQLHVAAEIT